MTCGDKYLHSSGCRYEPVQAGYLHNTVVLSNTVMHVHQQVAPGWAEEDLTWVLTHLDLGPERAEQLVEEIPPQHQHGVGVDASYSLLARGRRRGVLYHPHLTASAGAVQCISIVLGVG